MDTKRSTPVRATWVTMCTAGTLALFLDISILSSLVSMGTLFALGLVSLAVIVRRYYKPGQGDSAKPVAIRVGVLLFGAFFQGVAFASRWHPAVDALFIGRYCHSPVVLAVNIGSFSANGMIPFDLPGSMVSDAFHVHLL